MRTVNDYFWHQDSTFMVMVEKPLLVIGILFAVLLTAAVLITVRSYDDSDDV